MTVRDHRDASDEDLHRPKVVCRDRLTVEIRHFSSFPSSHADRATYELGTYLFFPQSFAITPDKLSKQEFYRDTNVLMRLAVPSLTLATLRDLNHPHNPATVLRAHLRNILQPNYRGGATSCALAQMFGAEFADAITKESDAMRVHLQQTRLGFDPQALLERVRHFCNNALGALAVLHRVRSEVQPFARVAHPHLAPSLAFAEEYTSALMDERLAALGATIDAVASLRDGQASATKLRLIVARTLDRLARRRQTQGFARPRGEGREVEYYAYRIGLLKKELQRSLYVNTRQRRTDPFYKNSAAMVAAGLAATWATLAQVPLLRANALSPEGIVIFAAAVGAYVMKDRIKDLVKERLVSWLHTWDQNQNIVGDALAAVGLAQFGGRVRERVGWCKADELPLEVIRLREKKRTVSGASRELEGVLHYERQIVLTPREGVPLPHEYGVVSILRISVDDIVRRLDDPTENISFYDGQGSFRTRRIPKVYHLNVIVEGRERAAGVCSRTRARVVLNKNGIVRIEQVA